MTQKSKLLVQGDYPLIASPTLAQAYGVPSAIFLQKLHYCLQSKGAKCIEQQKYFYHSYEQWVETLGIYSVSTIKRIVSKLKKAGVLIVKKLAQNKWLQTNFYSINYRKLTALLKVSTEFTDTILCTPLKSKPQSQHDIDSSKSSHHGRNIQIAKQSVKNSRQQTIPVLLEGLSQPLQPTAQSTDLAKMAPEKRGLYQQLLKLRVDIHFDDARLDHWIKNKRFIIHKAAYLKDQYGHLKMTWHSPEQLGLNS
ncbi:MULTISPECIES: hypothetical protein [unclassified Acinetobacter]|uniref:hypothetical protein n=1 Tax=unclassified Acinetobacter TaxID=196816 RepID=UPI0015D3D471|nr:MULTISPECIES: hypothetical protein [unclassified Acinetobacter]